MVVSSTDGYCTVISFERGELGEPYEPQEPMIVEPLEKVGDPEMKGVPEPVFEGSASDQGHKAQVYRNGFFSDFYVYDL